MFREPGVPAYLRGPSRGLISLGLIAFGCAMAYLGTAQSWTLAAVLCFGVAITVLAFFRVEWALFGLLVMSNVDGFLKPLLPGPVTLLLKDYFIGLAFARWLVGVLLARERRPSLRTTVAIPALLFAGYVAAQVLNPNSRGLMLSIAGLRAWLLWIPIYFIAHDYLRTRGQVYRFWQVAVALSACVAAYGIVQYLIGFEHLYRLSPRFAYYQKMGYWTEEGTKVFRVFSTMVHPGAFGSAMGFMVLAATGLAFSARETGWRVAALLTVLLAAVALFLSGSRAAMAGTGLGLVAFTLLARRPALLLVGGALALVGLWQSQRVTEGGLESRLASMTWEYTVQRAMGPFDQGMDIAMSHPFGRGISSGIGVSRSELEKTRRNPVVTARGREIRFIENDFGRALAELGVGAVLYVVLLGAAAVGGLLALWRLRSREDATLAAALLGGALVIAAGLMVGSSLYIAPGALYFWLAVATAIRLPDLAEGPSDPARREARAA